VTLFDFAKNVEIPLQPRIGVVGGDDVHLFDIAGDDIVGDRQNLLMAHGVGVGIFAAGAVGAEFADIFADIGRVDMAVDVKIGPFAVKGFATLIGQFTEGKEVQIIQGEGLFEIETLMIFYFFDHIHTKIFNCLF
jgi:hypothetical protein